MKTIKNPSVKLDKNKSCDIGFGFVILCRGKKRKSKMTFHKMIWSYIRKFGDKKPAPKVRDVEKMFADMLKKRGGFYLIFDTPLHSEVYWYNKKKKEWFLIEQGMGFA